MTDNAGHSKSWPSQRTNVLTGSTEELQDTLQAMSHAGIGWVRVEPDTGRILAVNAEFAERMGYSADHLTTHCRIGDLQQVSPDEVRNRIFKVKRDGSHRFETNLITRAGGQMAVDVFASYHVSGAGPDFIIGVITDIHERKQSQARLHSLESELQSLRHLETMRDTLGALAHELNQPLNAVVSYAVAALKLLDGGRAQAVALTQALEASVEQALHAGEVMNRLQAMLHQASPEPQVLMLMDLLRSAVVRVQSHNPSQIPIQIQESVQALRIRADPVQIELVLINLIRNALEALGAVHDHSLPRIDVLLGTQGNMATVTVCDNGPGIAPELTERIFDPFFTTKRSGTGMGLSVSRAIVKAHGGRLWADNSSVFGTCFHLSLPLAQPSNT